MSVKRKVGRPRKYEGSNTERGRQATAANRAKQKKKGWATIGLDQECMDLINEVQTLLRAKLLLPDGLQDKVKITYKDTVKIALTEYVRETRNG